MATVIDEAFPISSNRQASMSRAFSCKEDKTTHASVSAGAADTLHQTYTPQSSGTSPARMYRTSESKLVRFPPKTRSLENEDQDLFHGVRGLASAVLRDVSGWLTGQFNSTAHPAGSPLHLPKTKTDVGAAERPDLSEGHDKSDCGRAGARCSYAEAADSGSTSCSSSSLTVRRNREDKREQSGSSPLYGLLQNGKGCHLESESPEMRAETVPSTRATSHSHVNSYSAFPEKDISRTGSLSLRKTPPSHPEATQSDNECSTKNVGDIAECLPSARGFTRNGRPTCKRRNASPKKEISVPSVYEASYPGVSRWERNLDLAAEQYSKDRSPPPERRNDSSALTILTTSMKPSRKSSTLPLSSNNVSRVAQRESGDIAAAASTHRVDCCNANFTEKTADGLSVSRDAGSSVTCVRTGGSGGALVSLRKSAGDPSVCSSPREKNINASAAAGASSFLSSFTTSFREHFEAATKSHEEARKNISTSGGSGSSSVTGDKRNSQATVHAPQEKLASQVRKNPEFEVSGDWSFKPDALFASFMSLFDVDDDLGSRTREDAAALPAAAFVTRGTAVGHSRFGADNHTSVTKSPSDNVLRTTDMRQQRDWTNDTCRKGETGTSCLRSASSSIERVLPGRTKTFENVSSSSTTCTGASPTCTSSSIRKAASPLDFCATAGGSASDAASAHSAVPGIAPAALLKGVRRGVPAAPTAEPTSVGLRRNGTVTTDATFSETADGWFAGEELSPSELEEPADGITHPQTWMDDAAAYTLRCVTRSHIEISVLHLHNIGKIVDASLMSGRAQLRCPGFNMLHLRVPFFEPETQVITLQFTTRISRSHFALLQTLARCHNNRLLLQQHQLPQQHFLQQPRQQQYYHDLAASMEDPRWRRLLRQLRWHRRIDEDRKKDAEVKRYRVDIPVQALSKKESESRWVLLEDDCGPPPEGAPPAYLAHTEEEAKDSIYSPRLYLTINKRMSGLLQVPPVAPETATTYKRPEGVKFAGQTVYVGWYDDPIDGAVAETLNSHPDVLSLNRNIRRLEKGRYEVDGFECRIFLGSHKRPSASPAAVAAAAQVKDTRTGEKKLKARGNKGEEGRDGEKDEEQQTGGQPEFRGEGKERDRDSEKLLLQNNKETKKRGGEEDAPTNEGESREGKAEEEIVPLVQEGDTVQPLLDYLKGTLENITWSPPLPTSCIELIPPKLLPPLHATLVPWEARVERRKAMELACHRAAIREQVAAELLRLQKRPSPPLLYTKHVNPVLVRPAPEAPPVPMTYTWKEEYADVQLVILESGPAEPVAPSAPLQQPQSHLRQEQHFHTQQPQQPALTQHRQQFYTQQWQQHVQQEQNEEVRLPRHHQQHRYAQPRQHYMQPLRG